MIEIAKYAKLKVKRTLKVKAKDIILCIILQFIVTFSGPDYSYVSATKL